VTGCCLEFIIACKGFALQLIGPTGNTGGFAFAVQHILIKLGGNLGVAQTTVPSMYRASSLSRKANSGRAPTPGGPGIGNYPVNGVTAVKRTTIGQQEVDAGLATLLCHATDLAQEREHTRSV